MKLQEKLNTSQDFNGWFSREAKAVPSTLTKKGKSVVVEAVVTTEAPAIVVDWERWEIVREILLMDGVELPETKQVPLLDTHSRWSTSYVKGSIRDLKVEGDKLVGDVYFWSKAEDEISQVEEGHLTDLSAGYKTYEEFTIEVGKGAEAKVNGRVFKNDYSDGIRLLIRTKWDLKEGSLVPIGADKAAKFRSEMQKNPSLFDIDKPGIRADDPELQKKLDDAMKENSELKTKNEKLNIKLKEKEMKENENPDVPQKTEEEIRKADRERCAGIDSIANELVTQKLYKGGKEGLVRVTAEAKDKEWSVDKFRAHVWENLKNEDIFEKPVTDLDMSPKEYGKLSVKRALDAMIDLRGGNANAWDDHEAGREREAIMAATEAARKIPGIKLRGMALPLDFFKNPDIMRHSNVLKLARKNAVKNAEYIFDKGFGQRASDGISASDATYLIGTQNMFNEFIDVLRNLGVAGPWGVRMVSGANQNISVPKKTSTGTFHWVAESGTGTATDFVIGQLTATPKHGWASMKYTRQAKIQSVPALDALIIDDILNNVITGRDLALLHGTGASNQPTGITAASGIGDVVGVSLDWDAIVEFWTDVKTNNINSSNLRFVMNALTAGILMTRPVVAGQTQMLWDRLSQLSADPIISQQAAAANLVYGDGSEAWMVDFGVIDLLVNPFKDDTGDVVITAFTSMDILISMVTAFSVADDVS